MFVSCIQIVWLPVYIKDVKLTAACVCLPQPQPQANTVPKQRPQTLDSRFANMKEQRMRALSQQNNGGRRNGGGQQRQQWGRGRFGNQ